MNAPSDVKDLVAKIGTAKTPKDRNAAIEDLVDKIEAKHGDRGLDMIERAIARVEHEERRGVDGTEGR